MESLPHRPLTVLTLDVDFGAVIAIGQTAAGHRGIAPVTGGRFEGDRLSGTVRPGHDWFLGRGDGLDIDVRLSLDSDDGAILYLSYTGAMRASTAAMARFRQGEQLAPGDYALRIVARFECGDPRYAWLNDALVVGVGEQTPRGPVYHLFEITA